MDEASILTTVGTSVGGTQGMSNIQWLYCNKKGQLTYFGPSEGQINNNSDFLKNGCGDRCL